MVSTLTPSKEEVVRYTPYGAIRALWLDHSPEILLEGAAGTGKTRGVLELFHAKAIKYPDSKQLITRKTLTALTGAALSTLRDKVIHRELALGKVQWFGGSKAEPASFRYPNGSRIVVGGLDNAEKTFSTEYDNVYVNEATELTEEEWELLSRSLRNGVIPNPCLYGDCNPSVDRHWLLKRCQKGQTKRFHSTIQDNPVYWDEKAGDYTEEGSRYVEGVLGHLTGTRRQRLYEGQWVGMENAIYPQLDPSVQLVQLPERVAWETGAIGIDYGRVHLSAVVAVTRDSTGIYWVRECWAEAGGDPQKIEDMSRGMKVRYRISRGRVDPVQEYMAQKLAFNTAKMGAGSRNSRIGYVTRLLDAGALKFDADAPGVRDLFDEMLGYRYERRETETNMEDVVVRKDDDRVAALEYAIEELDTGARAMPTMAQREQTRRRDKPQAGWRSA